MYRCVLAVHQMGDGRVDETLLREAGLARELGGNHVKLKVPTPAMDVDLRARQSGKDRLANLLGRLTRRWMDLKRHGANPRGARAAVKLPLPAVGILRACLCC